MLREVVCEHRACTRIGGAGRLVIAEVTVLDRVVVGKASRGRGNIHPIPLGLGSLHVVGGHPIDQVVITGDAV